MNSRESKSAFTLIELLVVIAILAVLAGLLLPALNKGKAAARTAKCISNKRQITLAWGLYADDHSGQFPQNKLETPSLLPWTADLQSWNPWPVTTNIDYLISPKYSALAIYAKSAEIYVCPEDYYISPAQKAAGLRRRIRSVSMNLVFGPLRHKSEGPYWKIYANWSDLAPTTPAHRFLFIDEHPDTLWEPRFVLNASRNGGYGFANFPSSLHNGGATLSFADAHVETKRWKLADTRRPVSFKNWVGDKNAKTDFWWLWLRTGESRIQ